MMILKQIQKINKTLVYILIRIKKTLPIDWQKASSQMNIIAKIYEIIKYLKNKKIKC